jgi:pSer/pThr/pTyr-binding forkhead associated (FHA) protein
MLETADETLVAYSDASVRQAGVGLAVIGRHCLRAAVLPAGGELLLGRHPACSLSLPEPALSRHHARFVRDGEHVRVQDLGSRHGTWLVDKRIDEALLGVGTSVRLADVVVILILETSLQAWASHAAANEPGRADPTPDASLTTHSLRVRMASLEHEEMRRALARTGGNQRRAAQLLGMPLRTFERRLRSWRAQGKETCSRAEQAGPGTLRG